MKPNCQTCGKPVQFQNATRCNGCWEVESRLESYLSSEGGRRYVEELLEKTAVKFFHQQRRMFYVASTGEIKLASPGDTRSHEEWLREEHGIREPTLRGYIDDTGCYFYSTKDCRAQPGDWAKICRDLGRILLFLDVDAKLPIYEGTIAGKPGERWPGGALVTTAGNLLGRY